MVQPNNGFLVGKKEIALYVRRSWDIILIWIKTRGFPAQKRDGVWESSTMLIDEWRTTQIKKGANMEEAIL